MSFLAPLAFITGLLAVPIVLLYMLRLRRREVIVSSTYLWQQVLRDSEANTPWQRLRRNLLLFLQLLILAFLIFSLARPFITVPAVSSGKTALLLDASASMNATDGQNGSTRFAAAVERAQEIIATMGLSDSMTIIRVADVPEVLTPYTTDVNALRAALQNARPSHASADWTAALTLAAAGAGGDPNFSIVILSDGGLGEAETLPAIPGRVAYVPVGVSDSNLAISALATRTLAGQSPQLFAQITNYGQTNADVIFSLRVDGTLLTSERYTIPAQRSLPLVSQALPQGFRTLQANLTTPTDSTVPDYLAEDNAAYAISSGTGARRVLMMSDGNLFLEQMLRYLPGIEAFQGDIAIGLPQQPFDLYVFDSWLPETLPQADLLIFNPPRSSQYFTIGNLSQNVHNPTVESADPRMAFVDFSTINVLQFKQVTANWAQPLIRVDGGPLLLAGEIAGRQIAIVTFDLHESDLPLNIAWPILMSNLLEWFTPRSAINVPDGLDVGQSLALRPQTGATMLRITRPDGSTRDSIVDRETLIYAETDQIGLYTLEVLRGQDVLESAPFAVNLFDAGESQIAPRSQIALGDTIVVESQREELGQFEVWPLAALLALLILLIEWQVYHRRMRVPTVMGPALRRRRA
ncbi:MAG: VWA domain-containing protein [Chloroflexi bacterium]|nr:VWA domain-containing protein [Chloroflexota bacterium]